MKKKIIVVAGARPNFMKIAPLMKEFARDKAGFDVRLMHTGQHYDYKMSAVFFKDLDIAKPDMYLGVGSGSHAQQTAHVMTAFEKEIVKYKPDAVIVVGDVNSTVACSLVAAKLGIKVVHVEAGLRSFDRSMPEEINRVVTDSLSDYLFVSEESGLLNLRREGVHPGKVFYAGNVMIDTLKQNLMKIDSSVVIGALGLEANRYAVLTLHRPGNVDSKDALHAIYEIIHVITNRIPMVYPAHPRTRKMMRKFGMMSRFKALPNFRMTEPLGYIDFVKLVKESRFVLTDSGGIQEEATVLKVPCLTMRGNTERPSTVEVGTNELVGRDGKKILRAVRLISAGKWKRGRIPKYWDGKAAQRIVRVLKDNLCKT